MGSSGRRQGQSPLPSIAPRRGRPAAPELRPRRRVSVRQATMPGRPISAPARQVRPRKRPAPWIVRAGWPCQAGVTVWRPPYVRRGRPRAPRRRSASPRTPRWLTSPRRLRRGKEQVRICAAADRRLEISKESVADRIDPAVKRERLPSAPGVSHIGVACERADLREHIQFGHQIGAHVRVVDGLELRAMILADPQHSLKPVIEDPVAHCPSPRESPRNRNGHRR